MEQSLKAEKLAFNPKAENILNVAVKHVDLKAEVINTEEQVKNYGGKIGDYIVIISKSQKAFVMNKAIFEMMFQTSKIASNFCQCGG
jgi:hypothetical protein